MQNNNLTQHNIETESLLKKKYDDFAIWHYPTCLKTVKENADYLKDKVIIDIGSNIGLFTKAIVEIIPYAHIHLFEPSKEYFEESKKILNNSPNITFNNYGLSDKNKTLNLYKSKDRNIGWNTLIEIDPFHGNYFSDVMDIEVVKLVKLDDYYKDIDVIDFIKIDVEGHERQVIEGAWDLIKKFKPYILIEALWGIYHPEWNLNKKVYEQLLYLLTLVQRVF